MILLGDTHGNYGSLLDKLYAYGIKDTNIICAGDFGAGFKDFDDLNSALYELNIQLYVVRGNHDMKFMFNGYNNLSNITYVQDGTLLEIEHKKILCIGGARSIDREFRIHYGWPFCEEEEIDYEVSIDFKNLPSDLIVVTHSAPSFCKPWNTEEFFAKHLLHKEAILKERKYLADVFDQLSDKVTHWYYGHYHFSSVEQINNTTFRLLAELELHEHR